MRVLVTGHRGYIGVHLVKLLKASGHFVAGCDLDLFAGCAWAPFAAPDQEWITDFRALTVEQLGGFDCVMHLAALSNDAMGELDPAITYAVNRDGSIALAERAREAGVPRFLFSSSCSIYGRGEHLDLTEEAAFAPVSAYAVSKVEVEAALRQLASPDFSPVCLRNATAYGASPMFRIDLVANNLLACAWTRGEIRIMSDGTPWRPLIHCFDIARAFVAFLEAPRESVHNQAVNIGANEENYQVLDVATEVSRLQPGARVIYTGEVGPDPRNYRVNFDRLQQLLPGFRLRYSLRSGLEEMHRLFAERGFTRDDFEGARFVRLRTLKARLTAEKSLFRLKSGIAAGAAPA